MLRAAAVAPGIAPPQRVPAPRRSEPQLEHDADRWSAAVLVPSAPLFTERRPGSAAAVPRASIPYRNLWEWYGDRLAGFATSLQARDDDELLTVTHIHDRLLPASWVPTERKRLAWLD